MGGTGRLTWHQQQRPWYDLGNIYVRHFFILGPSIQDLRWLLDTTYTVILVMASIMYVSTPSLNSSSGRNIPIYFLTSTRSIETIHFCHDEIDGYRLCQSARCLDSELLHRCLIWLLSWRPCSCCILLCHVIFVLSRLI